MQKDLLEQKATMIDHQLSIEEHEQKARSLQSDGDALNFKLDQSIEVILEQIQSLNVKDVQAEVQHIDTKVQAISDEVRTLIANCRNSGEPCIGRGQYP